MMRHNRKNKWVPDPPTRKQKTAAKRIVAEIATEVSSPFAEWLSVAKNRKWAENRAANHIALIEGLAQDPSAPRAGGV
jgi:hypothetical protein